MALVNVNLKDENGNIKKDAQGNPQKGFGSAFFIGGGYWVTARHVAANEITSMVAYDLSEFQPKKTIVSANDKIDVAILETDYSIPEDPEKSGRDQVDLDAYFDRWIDDNLILSPVLLMGYPTVPLADERVLVAYESSVNAVIELSTSPHRHIVVSGMARPGFSGGPILDSYGKLLAICTISLTEFGVSELGFITATGTEPLLDLLRDNKIQPGPNTFHLRRFFPGYV